MDDHNEQRRIRREKLDKLKEMGINPYPYRFAFTHRAAALLEEGEALIEAETEVALAGLLNV